MHPRKRHPTKPQYTRSSTCLKLIDSAAPLDFQASSGGAHKFGETRRYMKPYAELDVHRLQSHRYCCWTPQNT